MKKYTILKYRVLTTVLVSLTLFTVFSFVPENKLLQEDILLKEQIIKEKEEEILKAKAKIKTENYVENITNKIGHKFTKSEIRQIEEFTGTYREDIEEARIPMSLVVWIAYKESNFNHLAKNPKSSASGLFGFIDGTWNSMAKIGGVSNSGRYDKDKQVKMLTIYLNHLYRQKKDWKAVVMAYHGNKLQYSVKFLDKKLG